MPDKTDKPNKRLEVSTTPAIMGSAPVQPGEKPAEPKSKLFKAAPIDIITPQSLGVLVNPVNFIGKHVVYQPKTAQLTNPIDDRDEAHNYAQSIQEKGEPAVVMLITAQFIPT